MKNHGIVLQQKNAEHYSQSLWVQQLLANIILATCPPTPFAPLAMAVLPMWAQGYLLHPPVNIQSAECLRGFLEPQKTAAGSQTLDMKAAAVALVTVFELNL